MSEQCDHACASCGQDCGERTAPMKEPANAASRIGKVIGVVSGKGGVGKSLVTSLLAAQLQREGLQTAVLDADITGPSVPRAFGVAGGIMGSEAGMVPAASTGGTRIMSTNLLLESETDPVVWRGPMIAGVVKQFWTDVAWGDVDVMLVDMPPGTGDVPLTVFQSLPVDGIVIVTSPQELVSMIVTKAVKMAEAMDVPVLALVENMAYFECPDCGARHAIFGDGHVRELAAEHGIPVTAQLPIDPTIATAVDAGKVEEVACEAIAPVVEAVR